MFLQRSSHLSCSVSSPLDLVSVVAAELCLMTPVGSWESPSQCSWLPLPGRSQCLNLCLEIFSFSCKEQQGMGRGLEERLCVGVQRERALSIQNIYVLHSWRVAALADCSEQQIFFCVLFVLVEAADMAACHCSSSLQTWLQTSTPLQHISKSCSKYCPCLLFYPLSHCAFIPSDCVLTWHIMLVSHSVGGLHYQSICLTVF